MQYKRMMHEINVKLCNCNLSDFYLFFIEMKYMAYFYTSNNDFWYKVRKVLEKIFDFISVAIGMGDFFIYHNEYMI